jgi:hypothetical protein
MENVELTIAVGAAILIYKRLEITVWQENHESPFSFEFAVDGKSVRRKTKTRSLHTAARHVRARVDQELRKRRDVRRRMKKSAPRGTRADSKS